MSVSIVPIGFAPVTGFWVLPSALVENVPSTLIKNLPSDFTAKPMTALSVCAPFNPASAEMIM